MTTRTKHNERRIGVFFPKYMVNMHLFGFATADLASSCLESYCLLPFPIEIKPAMRGFPSAFSGAELLTRTFSGEVLATISANARESNSESLSRTTMAHSGFIMSSGQKSCLLANRACNWERLLALLLQIAGLLSLSVVLLVTFIRTISLSPRRKDLAANYTERDSLSSIIRATLAFG